MYYLYDKLILDREPDADYDCLRVSSSSEPVPIFAASPAVMASIFGMSNKYVYPRATKLSKTDTRIIAGHILNDAANLGLYKDHAMMHHGLKIDIADDYSTVTLTFNVYYHLWKLDESEENSTYKDIVTDKTTYTFEMDFSDYAYIVAHMCIYDTDLVDKVIESFKSTSDTSADSDDEEATEDEAE